MKNYNTKKEKQNTTQHKTKDCTPTRHQGWYHSSLAKTIVREKKEETKKIEFILVK